MEPAPSLAQRYRAEGYVVVRGLITGDDLRALERLVDLTLDGELQPVAAYKGWLPPDFYTHWEPGREAQVGLPRRDRVRSIANMYHHHPEWRKIGQHPSICEVVASLYQQEGSSGVQFLNDAVWMKPSGGLGATLHQDTGFPTIAAASNPNSMNFWLAIDAATQANGCLFVAPGSHSKTLPHDPHPVQGRIMRPSAAASLPALVPVELEPGDGIFFDSALAHMSPPNRSEGSRRAYACIYGAGRMSYMAPESAMRTDTVAGAAPSYHFEMIPSSTSSKL